MMIRTVSAALMLLACLAGTAQAAENVRVYAAPTLGNLEKAMLRGGALDATNHGVLRDYMIIHECQMFRDNQRDDFKMERIEAAIGKLINEQKTTWPDAFMFVTPLQLDKYDFASSSFKINGADKLQNVNSFILLENSGPLCQQGLELTDMPPAISVRIDQPVTVAGIPLPKDQADALLQRMLKAGNVQRQIFARFKIAVSFMMAITPRSSRAGEAPNQKYTFDGTLQGIDFFEDEAMTKLIWSFSR